MPRFLNQIEEGEKAEFKDAADRYVLYINLGCPWACSALAVLHLRGLGGRITVACTRAETESGEWVFDKSETSTVMGS